VGIEGLHSHIKAEQSVLLFLPEGEHHELGLLYMYYLLKNRGIHTLYLGANVPVKDVEFVARLKKPDYLYSHLTFMAGNFNFEKFLQQVQAKLAGFPVVISGQLTRSYKKKLPANVTLMKSLHETMEYVGNL
jgi:methanogenic corrinoid protein MtbC1